MYYHSTRDRNIRVSLSEAIHTGIADDGGLFVPEYLPKINLDTFKYDETFSLFAKKILQAFFLNDVLANKLAQICDRAFNFPIELQSLNETTYLLELFHGPTLSFKDFGARFLAECLQVMTDISKTTILVATSGDTGSAVASAFYLKSNINVIILYPKGKISARQEQQITCWHENIMALAVDGSFDDCQKLVKQAFQDRWWRQHFHLSSANSINIGRLLPQIVYYAYSSMQFYLRHHVAPGFIVPTGNLGNATAGYWAKAMGFPIREIVLATNANTTLIDYLQTGKYMPRPSVATLANAMDVGNPSNFERLQHLFNDFDIFKNHVNAISTCDDDIIFTIKQIYQQHKKIICPHTATACFARSKLSEEPWIIVATADASKFENLIQPIIQTHLPIAPQLQMLLDKPAHIINVDRDLEAIKKYLLRQPKSR